MCPNEDDQLGSGWTTGGCWRKGKLVVLDVESDLPGRCVRCNAPSEGRVRKKLAWHHLALYLLLFAGVLPYFVGSAIVRETAIVSAPLCGRHMSRHRRLKQFALGLLAIGMVLVVVGFAVESFGTLAFATGSVIAAGILGLIYSNLLISARRIDKRYTWLAGIDASFVEALPDYEHRKRRDLAHDG